MPIVNDGLNVMSANMAGSNININFIAIGESDDPWTENDSSLGSELKRVPILIKDLTTPHTVIMNAAFTPTEISGLTITEIGTFTQDDVLINREVLTVPITFDGLSEFQVQQSIVFAISGT